MLLRSLAVLLSAYVPSWLTSSSTLAATASRTAASNLSIAKRSTKTRTEVQKQAFAFALKWEKGVVAHPQESGGLTVDGITQDAYDVYRLKNSQPMRSVHNLTEEERTDIYCDYWAYGSCHLLPDKIAIVHFDTTLHCGAPRAVKLLQVAVEAAVDGKIGEETLNLVWLNDEAHLVAKYIGCRASFYLRLARLRKEKKQYLRGWLRRLNDLREEVNA